MTIVAAHSEVCAFCEGRLVAQWEDIHLWRCNSCGLAFRNPMPVQTELTRLYEDGWREPEANQAETGGTDLRLARIYARRLAASLGERDFEGLRIIDFGAGTGAMSHALREQGAEVTSVDPFGYERLHAQGLTAYRSLSAIPRGELFDGAVSLDVVEHLRAPWEDLAELRERTVPGGWIYVSTLNTASANARLTRGNWREARKAGHVVFFDPRALELVLARAGFVDMRRPRWLVPYTRNPFRAALHTLLQTFRLETGLRAIAVNGGRP